MKLTIKKAFCIMALVTLSTGSKVFSQEYAKKGTVEMAGQATIAYSAAPNSKISTNVFYLGFQPTISYFLADSWYIGTGIQGNLNYTSASGSWSYYGDFSAFGGKTIELRKDLFFFGQLAIGSSLPYVSQNGGIENRYYFFRPTIGLKVLLNNIVITTALNYTLTQNKYSWDPDYYATHTIQLGLGVGFYF